MVEQNDNNNEEAPKRRTRLFGGRRARSGGQEARADVTETGTGADVVAPGAHPDALALSAAAPSAADPGTAEPSVSDTVAETVSLEVDTTANATADPHDVSTLTGDLPVVQSDALTDAGGDATVETADAAPSDPAADGAPAAAPVAEDVPVASAPAAAEPEQPFVPVATSTTSLIFHAPVLPVLPERPFTERSRDRFADRAVRPDDDDDRPDSPIEDDQGDQPTGRRRSRRRGGASQQDDAPDDRQQRREPRQRREPELITEPQRIKGSTRLEAKKQRRRDGRDAGRRRTVITEDEFLARRESVDRQMIVRSHSDTIEIGVLEDGSLAEHYLTKNHNVSLIGNVYLGKVQNVLPSMEAAFVDIGRGRNAVLYSGEVDWNSLETGNQPRRIELALKPGDKVLVQVTKDPVGHKGARLTSQISLPGRYLVYVPNGSMNGISRKLPDTERSRLKKILKEVLPEHAGVIVRTAAEGATEEQLTRDVSRLTNQWEAIQKKVAGGQAPVQLHSEPDLLVKIVRDVFNEDFTKLIIDGEAAHAVIDEYLSAVAPDLKDRVETYQGPDSFEEHRLNEQIEKALDRKVWLPSGGSLVIDRTEAMTVVDVNTGKFVGSGGNLEETVTKNNLEAAEELVRQLRLRDIGGIIVVDFIDMVLETNRDLVLRRLVECLSRDRTKHQVAEVTSLGLVQMTRKKIGVGLQESLDEVNARVNDNTAESSPKGARSGRKGRSGNGNGNSGGGNSGNGGSAHGNNGGSSAHAHQITADVTNALSRIAASTIAHEGQSTSAPSKEAPAEPAVAAGSPEPTAAVTPGSNGAESTDGGQTSGQGDRPSRRSRRSRRGAEAPSESAAVSEQAPVDASRVETVTTPVAEAPVDATPDDATPEAAVEEAPAAPQRASEPSAASAPRTAKRSASVSRRVSTSAPVAPSETQVAIFDIPVVTAKREPRKVDPEAAESILDSVLSALPEPKQPGQGRSRSRRVSSGSISAPATTEASSSDGPDDAVIVGS
ncbi:Rne/Rng family ribonuclease [Curtobacterium sp. Leaf261]|uniref:Rne/Rng family ribonuclease n=1 Tax=Curtobacterium sp. Leaf261 TaxID=1736311 RepID=UPI0007009A3C|nr:Rne/Rng family ribonuclease [Curtobacterium sp. Leaf261]KQO63025.1 ribonuclease G [Curtobacterium sp. Leaf261]